MESAIAKATPLRRVCVQLLEQFLVGGVAPWPIAPGRRAQSRQTVRRDCRGVGDAAGERWPDCGPSSRPAKKDSAELARNNLDRGRGIRPASLSVSGPDRKGLNAGTHLHRNMEVQVEYRIRATASRAFRDRQFCAPAEHAQIREGTDVRAGWVGCTFHRYDASERYVLAGTKRSPAPGRYNERSRGRSGSGTRRNRPLLRSGGWRGRSPAGSEQSDSGTQQRNAPTFGACHRLP
jgi:hypothetical protein